MKLVNKKFKLKKAEDNSQEIQEDQQSWLDMEMQVHKSRFRLGAINRPEYYSAVLDHISMLGENDEVEVIIDSIGGDLDGCIALCDALQTTQATVTGVMVNRAFSAGAFIALCCDNLEVRPNARMMLHSYSGSFGGKDHEIDLDYNFNKNYIRKFFASCCEDFLTEEELDQMYNGKDLWFDNMEIVERLKLRQEINKMKYELLEELAEEGDNDEDQEEYKYNEPIELQYDPVSVAFKQQED